MKDFNENPNEKSLLEVGNNFFEKLLESLSATEVENINLKQITYFIHIYLYNIIFHE